MGIIREKSPVFLVYPINHSFAIPSLYRNLLSQQQTESKWLQDEPQKEVPMLWALPAITITVVLPKLIWEKGTMWEILHQMPLTIYAKALEEILEIYTTT